MRVMFTLAVTLVAVATGVTIATASSPGDRLGGKHGHVFTVTRDAGTGAALDLDHSATPGKPPAPDSIGDENVFSANFYMGDKRVGFDGGVCTLVRMPAYFQCVATNSFPEGDLMVQFLADFSRSAPGRFAITGGTRGYRGAQGEVTYIDNPDPQRDVVTFRFTTR